MPPFVAVAQIVKVAGAAASNGAIVGPPGPAGQLAEYTMRAGGGAATSVPTGATYTHLPFGAVSMSTLGAECFRANADGSLTILQDGWYTLSSVVGRVTTSFTSQGIRVRTGIWVNATDVLPSPPAGLSTYSQAPVDTALDAQINMATVTFLAAGNRVGACAFHGDSAARTMQCAHFAAARVGSGIPGPKGDPGVTTGPPLVTSLPGGPTDGQEVYFLADAANGIVWHLRYRAASASPYKWEVVGGAALFAYETASQGAFSNTAEFDKNGGPTLAIPLAGDYELTYSASVYNSAANNYVYNILRKSDNSALPGVGYVYHGYFGGTAAFPTGVHRATGLTVGTIKWRCYVAAGSATISEAHIFARPIRVG
jgi:hypothetical protein